MEAVTFRRFEQNSGKKILFCGDDDIDQAAVYLAAIIYAEDYDLDYLPSVLPFLPEISVQDYDLIILSDYPRVLITDQQMHSIRNYVLDGGSFLMIGGWESFYGRNGEYNNSPVEDILPVKLQEKDDRVNCAQGVLVLPGKEIDPLLKELDWEHPPLIGGYNAFTAGENSSEHLFGKKIRISGEEKNVRFQLSDERIPLLVTANRGKGTSAALAFDLAPHWIGGMVDWGKRRKHIDMDRQFIEVGDMYHRFVRSLLKMLIKEKQ
ncbi:MAG: glutamine amidotransferase [Candidatus Marinimicrobia bacterium]|nr:glutamine amidotransferase [Candidatus Neomarinimicrobiota bacterium]